MQPAEEMIDGRGTLRLQTFEEAIVSPGSGLGNVVIFAIRKILDQVQVLSANLSKG